MFGFISDLIHALILPLSEDTSLLWEDTSPLTEDTSPLREYTP